MEQIVYLNGVLIPRSEARISPFDFGFLYGYALFESMRSYSGKVFRLDRHLFRLERSSEVIGLNLPQIDLERAVYDTIEANGLTNARIRLTVSLGQGEATPDPSTCKTPTVFITANAYLPLPDTAYQKGYSAVVSQIRRNSTSPLAQVKSANYLDMMLARTQAKNAGADEALLLNEQGYVAEGSTSNVFIVSDGRLITPSLDSGILPGVTREVILKLASSLGIEVEERLVGIDELYQADEAFLSNSVMEIMPLIHVDGKRIGSSVGIITNKLISEYKTLVKKELDL
ncbi:MAG: aminotransferase class IV [Chloroflexi bacterium]|jgi:branched-chain amino acid aminotransferase|nr:aminotransferase class IV [Chloroflexota bacterium]MBT7082454.1 aminotransferase class IV [Chloroflexota bacterium]MBT7290037.1 aminotransferase class IV [Chloroflexota bacterium]